MTVLKDVFLTFKAPDGGCGGGCGIVKGLLFQCSFKDKEPDLVITKRAFICIKPFGILI